MSRWKQGDTIPAIVIDCFDGDGRRPQLNTASEVRLKAWQRGTLVINRLVTGDANGMVTEPIQASDTANPGSFKVKVFAQWPDGSRQHYPPADDYMTMTVTR